MFGPIIAYYILAIGTSAVLLHFNHLPLAEMKETWSRRALSVFLMPFVLTVHIMMTFVEVLLEFFGNGSSIFECIQIIWDAIVTFFEDVVATWKGESELVLHYTGDDE